MNAKQKIGVWMDYTTAHLMEFSTHPHEKQVITSALAQKKQAKEKSEKHVHTIEKQVHTEYFKQIASALLPYDKILLFGPTHAKNEFFNLLRADHRFDAVKMSVQDTDKMTLNQRHQFIHAHFSSPMHQ